MDAPRAQLERAKRLYGEGKMQESEAAFKQVIASGEHTAEGLYGIGMVHLSLGDSRSAVLQFKSALQQDPRHANAIYQLGLIAERQNLSEEARALYRRTLAINPQHVGAQRKLSKTEAQASLQGMIRTESKGTPARSEVVTPQSSVMGISQQLVGAGTTEPDIGAPGIYGVYEFLLRDSSSLSKQTVNVIDSLRMSVRPTLSAYLAKFLWLEITIAVLLLTGLIQISYKDSEPVGRVLLALCLFAAVLASLFYATIVRTRITIDKGRLQISKGVFQRHLRNVELWRVQNIELHRTFLNQMTGDGSLIFHMLHETKPITVTGVCKGPQLDETFQKLLNLVFLLRGNPVVKGIIV